jgi:hypothetical protein
LTALSAVVYTASAYSDFEFGSLVKRDHGLPFDTLPSTSCAAPAACQNITQPANCRCSNELTTCENSQGQFCWGSTTLNITSCPSIPTDCASTFTGTPSCLCNAQKMLCVDEKNNYCYATITGTGSSAVASVAALPSVSASGAASSGSVSNPSASDAGVSANPTAAASGAEQLNHKAWVAASFAVLAYIASH